MSIGDYTPNLPLGHHPRLGVMNFYSKIRKQIEIKPKGGLGLTNEIPYIGV